MPGRRHSREVQQDGRGRGRMRARKSYQSGIEVTRDRKRRFGGKEIKTPGTVKLAQALFFLNAAIWLSFGIFTLLKMVDPNPADAFTLAILSMLMFGNVGAMLVCAGGIGKRRKGFYLLAIAVLAVNIVLSITDEFGFFDFLVLALDALLLGLLVVRRQSFLPALNPDT
jgi:hypothetical protein